MAEPPNALVAAFPDSPKRKAIFGALDAFDEPVDIGLTLLIPPKALPPCCDGIVAIDVPLALLATPKMLPPCCDGIAACEG